jgi:hypothetical protein
MEKDDIIICIDNSNIEDLRVYPREPSPIIRLTLYKEYRITWANDLLTPDSIYLVDDYGAQRKFYKWRFLTKAQWRERQLEMIL